MQIPDLKFSQQLYQEGKFWVSAGGIIWSVFKIVAWVKAIKTNDLHHIQKGIENFNTQLDKGFTQQTDAFVSSMNVNTNELKELRHDLGNLTSAILNQTAAKAARARKK